MMANPRKQKGTAAETAVVNYVSVNGWPYAERRALNGATDRGDLAGLPGVVVEIKNHARMDLAGWVDEAEIERINDNAAVGAVWHKRRGRSNPADWFVSMTGAQFVQLLRDAGYGPPRTTPSGRDDHDHRTR